MRYLLRDEFLLSARLEIAGYEFALFLPADLNEIAGFDTGGIGSAVDVQRNTFSLLRELPDPETVGFHNSNLESSDEDFRAGVRRGVEDSYFEHLIDEIAEIEFGVSGFEVDSTRCPGGIPDERILSGCCGRERRGEKAHENKDPKMFVPFHNSFLSLS